MKEIIIGSHIVLVDDEDYEWISAGIWKVKKSSCNIYAWSPGTGIYLHRCLMKLPSIKLDPRVVDHIDHNTLNNQKNNLRVCSDSENKLNRAKANSHSRTKLIGIGIYKLKNGKEKYYGSLKIGKKRKCVSTGDTAIEAAKLRNEYIIKHGINATLNIIEE